MARKCHLVFPRVPAFQRATGSAAWSAVCVCLTHAGYAVQALVIAATSNRQHGLKSIRDGVHQYYHCDSNHDAEFLFTWDPASCEAAPWRNRATAAAEFKIWISSGHRLSSMACNRRWYCRWWAIKRKCVIVCSRSCAKTDADEIMVNGQIFDHQARLHSFELAMDVKEELLG